MKAIIASSIGAALSAAAEQAPGSGHRPSSGAGASIREHRVPTVHLTQRQLEVLALLCEGLPNKLICRRLNIATGTVKVHISCILRELGVASRLEAVVAANRYGLPGESAPGVAARAGMDAPAHLPAAAGARHRLGRYEDAVAF